MSRKKEEKAIMESLAILVEPARACEALSAPAT